MSTRKYSSGYEKVKKKKKKGQREELIESQKGAILSIENEMLVELECKNLISNFASQKTRKIDFN